MNKEYEPPLFDHSLINNAPYRAKCTLRDHYAVEAKTDRVVLEAFGVGEKTLKFISDQIEEDIGYRLAVRETDEEGNIIFDQTSFTQAIIEGQLNTVASRLEKPFVDMSRPLLRSFVDNVRNRHIFEQCDVKDLHAAITATGGLPCPPKKG